VLKLYKMPELLSRDLPALRLLARPAGEIRDMANVLLPRVQQALPKTYEVNVETCASQIGSGSLPVDHLSSWCLCIRPAHTEKAKGRLLDELASRLRNLPVPIIGRIERGSIKLDLRCLEDEDLFVEQIDALWRLYFKYKRF
jgi:L-seryl-tRNA(Ser) seleniumtransferase